MNKKVFLLFLIILPLSTLAFEYSFPYSPEAWRTPLCFVDDWHKSLVDHQGNLTYDFGPGPYAKPKTVISVDLKNADLKVTRQSLNAAHIPIVETIMLGEKAGLKAETFSLYDSSRIYPPEFDPFYYGIERYNGYVGAVAWADPDRSADPAFRNVAWGTGRPIRYDIKVEPGAGKKVALGFCDSYREKDKISRIMKLEVEGAGVQMIDLLKSGEQNEPQVFLFSAKDTDSDGKLGIVVSAAEITQDPNTLINAIWVFPPGLQIDRDKLIAGELSSKAEVYIDCGLEPPLRHYPGRYEAMVAEFNGEAYNPLIRIKSGRLLDYNADDKILTWQKRPFLVTRPAAESARFENGEWILLFAANIPKLEAIVCSGFDFDYGDGQFPDLNMEREKAIDYWNHKAPLPWSKYRLPDKRIEALIQASMRTLYQVREIVHGYPQFQPGPTVYRGFWASDGIWDADAALAIGDFRGADYTIDRFIDYQKENGRVEIMSPSLLHRETPHFIWLLYRYAVLSGDKAWLQERWPHMEKAVAHIQELRQRTFTNADVPYYGLIPPGLTDGGIGGVNPEYGGVFWSLIGLKTAIEAARYIDKSVLAEQWQREYDTFLQYFRAAAERDMRQNDRGNVYLPMKMNVRGDIPDPQRGQAQMGHLVFPGNVFGLEQPFVRGMLEIFDQNLVQGLVIDSGWLKGGVWPFFAAHRGLAELWVGRPGRSVDALFAFADHATPTLNWVEEQMPAGEKGRIGGDQPQTNASAQIIRLVRHLLLLERGCNLEVFNGLPRTWLYPGAQLQLNEIATELGPVSVEMSIEKDGQTARLNIDATDLYERNAQIEICMQAFKAQGFMLAEAVELPDVLKTNRKKITLTLVK
ncbi:hypothetical protein GF407_09345 [candidate division KSB1 bacterium]|nr:hypothetical protein [candidate division KSB1 bacterium]